MIFRRHCDWPLAILAQIFLDTGLEPIRLDGELGNAVRHWGTTRDPGVTGESKG
jgi:hypothetical protein